VAATGIPTIPAELAVADEPADILSPEDDPAYRVFLDSLNYLSPEEIDLFRKAYLFGEKRTAGRFASRENRTSPIPWPWPGPIAD